MIDAKFVLNPDDFMFLRVKGKCIRLMMDDTYKTPPLEFEDVEFNYLYRRGILHKWPLRFRPEDGLLEP